MTRIPKLVVLVVTVSTLLGTAGVAGADVTAVTQGDQLVTQPSENSEADISVEFTANCTAFTVESSKDISFVSINFDNDSKTYVKYENGELEERDESGDGDATTFAYSGDTEIKSIVVKSGTTERVFNCNDDGNAEPEPPGNDPECANGGDDDGDGIVDHPDDPGCETPDDDDERDGSDDGDDDDGDDDNGDDDDGSDGAAECTGGNPIAVAIGGQSSGDESAENDDNLIDANVLTESDHESDCDTIDADVGTHSNSADNDSDAIDIDAGTSNDATGDEDAIDVDAGSNNTATADNDSVDADIGSESQADEDTNQLDVDIPPEDTPAPPAVPEPPAPPVPFAEPGIGSVV